MYKLHMSFHPLVIWAMICPMAYKIMEKMDLGVMIAPTESSGIPHELKLDESEITIVKSYIETLIPKNIDRFIQEFKYDIK